MKIELKNISKKYNNINALENVNTIFEKKETIAIIGNSGSGKSTLLRCINHLEDSYEGDVIINDKILTRRNRKILCSKIGMVFQQFNLFPHMNVLENIVYGPIRLLNQNKEQVIKRAISLLKEFSIDRKLRSNINNLSGGQKQRVAIVRALIMNPKIMLFDEPTSALDPEVIQDVIDIINKLKNNMMMVIVTHHIKFAKLIADRIIFMDGGKILADQRSDDFFTNPSSNRAKIFLENVETLI
ncbi:MAG TPA: amino acid ABC transporter ATP-binding protein [Candidatus Megaira endosymbiont of Hartmannula sinica]|nr:amino acid ABC transporter ATP-binding protein [Candidatus Megaera endosymbiont of Hartmannula sinica]